MGSFTWPSAPPGRAEFAELAKDLATQVAVHKIRVVLNTPSMKRSWRMKNRARLFWQPVRNPSHRRIPGVDLPHVVQSWDVLQNRVATGRQVVVIGGGAVGVETALFLGEKGTLSGEALKFLLVNKAETPEDLYELATQGTKDVVLIEMVKKVGKDIGSDDPLGHAPGYVTHRGEDECLHQSAGDHPPGGHR